MTASDPPVPRADLIGAGLRDLARGIESEPALLVSIGAPHLRALGVSVEHPFQDAEQRLYERLQNANPDGAHSRDNALIRRLVTFESMLVCGESVNRDRILRLMTALDAAARKRARVYFSGDATAVLLGWRYTGMEVDLELVPLDHFWLPALAAVKRSLGLTIKLLASPARFIPVPRGWERRSPFIARRGRVSFHHFDLYAQALAKVERGHSEDMTDLGEMLRRGIVDRARALRYFRRIEPELYRYPGIDPPTFRRAVERAFGSG
jgi:hypothetical protein